jgi:hypothetical protein
VALVKRHLARAASDAGHLPMAPLRCTLDEPGLAAQRARYQTVAGHLTGLRRDHEGVVAELDPAVDRAVLEELIEVERGCCPFFDIGYDPSRRRLTVAVREPEHEPALDAIEHVLRSAA